MAKEINERELLELKDKINKAKPLVAELRGKRDYLLKQIKEEYQCTSMEQILQKEEELEKEIEEINQKIQQNIKKIQNDYNL
ncbi:MAG TPA: hypothetical protein PK588_08655 [Paludibacteraceae bacterium]|nr:hypothetical protein [Paludibacteraceae bacterium]